MILNSRKTNLIRIERFPSEIIINLFGMDYPSTLYIAIIRKIIIINNSLREYDEIFLHVRNMCGLLLCDESKYLKQTYMFLRYVCTKGRYLQ